MAGGASSRRRGSGSGLHSHSRKESSSSGRQARLDEFFNVAKAKDLVFQALRDMTLERGWWGFFKLSEIAKAAGVSEIVAERALEQLRREGLVMRHGSGKKYRFTKRGIFAAGIAATLGSMYMQILQHALEYIRRLKAKNNTNNTMSEDANGDSLLTP